MMEERRQLHKHDVPVLYSGTAARPIAIVGTSSILIGSLFDPAFAVYGLACLTESSAADWVWRLGCGPAGGSRPQ